MMLRPDLDFVNHQWVQNGADLSEIPDCGHQDCGVLCDNAILTGRAIVAAREDFRLAVAGPRLADRNAEVRAIKRLLGAGLTLRQIAYHLSEPLTRVIDLLLQTQPRGITARDFLEAERLLRLSHTDKAVSEVSGLPTATVLSLRRWILG